MFVPDENLLGEENRGFYLIMANFQWERLIMALGRGGLDGGGARAGGSRREPAARRWRHAVAEMAVKHEASRCLTYHALRLFANGHDALREVTEAKLLSQRSAFEVAETAFRILDGDLEIGRALRDTRLGPIGGGTDEVMKEILGEAARALGAPAPRGALGLVRPAPVLVEERGERPPRGRAPCRPRRPSGRARSGAAPRWPR